MGGHFGSVQVRTEDRARVIEVAEQIATSLSIRMLVGPALKGWVGIYPENDGADESVGQQIAEILRGYVIHVLVYDDDVFAYWLHHHGKLVDSFNSRPGYFSEDDRAREEAMAGNPQAFEPIAPRSLETLAKLLDRNAPRPTFEVETLLDFGKALGIENLITSYEMLKGDEREGVKGWRQFIELPRSLVKEAAARKEEEKRQIKAERDRLKKDGVLLAREEFTYFLQGDCAVGDGFLVRWADPGWLQFTAPWRKPTAPSLPCSNHWPPFCSDPTGNRVAIGTDKIEIWEWDASQWHHRRDIATEAQPGGMQIHFNGKRISCYIGNHFKTFDIESGETLFDRDSTPSSRHPVLHPDGQWLIRAAVELQLIPLMPDGVERALYLVTTSMISMKPELLAALTRSTNPRARELFTHTETEGIHDGNFGLTADGRWLWIRARRGLLLFEWESILQSTDTVLPPPRWTFTVSGTNRNGFPASFTTIAAGSARDTLIAGDTLGRLYRLDMSDGSSTQFFQLPGRPCVLYLTLAANQKKLGIGSGIYAADNLNTAKWVFEVYDYEKLSGKTITGSNPAL